MPLYKIMDEMPYDEFVGWFSYFKRRPVGWQDDQRTYMQLSAAGVKAKAEELFPSIAAVRKSQAPKTQAHSLVQSGFLEKLKSVAKRNGVDWNPEVSSEIDGKGS